MKIDFKNKNMCNSIYSVAFMGLSCLFIFWYAITFIVFTSKILSVILFLFFYFVFVIVTVLFLKVSNSNIARIIITIFSVISIKEYIKAPLQIVINHINNMPIQSNSAVVINFLIQTIIVILNISVLTYALYRMHQESENVKLNV